MEHCCSYFSVSVEITLWSHVFLWLDGFYMLKSYFSKTVLWNTLLPVNVDQCDCVFWNQLFSNIYRPSSVLRWIFCRFDELFKRFHADPLNGTLSHHTLGAAGFTCVVTSSITMAYFLIIPIQRCFGFMCAVTSSITMDAAFYVMRYSWRHWCYFNTSTV
jgi:hypothetical protein